MPASEALADPTQADPVSGFWTSVARGYLWVATRPALACSAVFLLTLGIRIALLPWMHVPEPAVHDEFSYLLAADTYASGRLTNPPHPFWQHFETFHVLQQPTYVSKYPPLPGLVMALGQALFGEPWVGVLLTTALMCAAICWMLQGWISPGPALLGGLLAMLRFGIFDYWMNSYFGGAVPAIGGALIFGALARILFREQTVHGVTLGAGLAVLVASRPFDFVALGAISAAVVVWALLRRKLPAAAVVRVSVAATIVVALAGAGMGYNNYRVTGDALLLPYQAFEKQYGVTSVFLWSKPHAEPPYHHEILRKYWAGWFVNKVRAAQQDPGGNFFTELSQIYDFYFGFWPMLIPPLIWPYRLKSAQERIGAVLLGVGLIALVAPLAGIMPHYVASIACLIYLRFLQTLTRLWSWRPSGRPIGFAIATGCVTFFVYHFVANVADLRTGEAVPRLAIARNSVVKRLDQEPGQKLVLVRYSPNHYLHEEWVNNLANIDAQPIVWAREMGGEQDRPLIQYFHNRQVWLVEPDQSPAKLSRYAAASVPR